MRRLAALTLLCAAVPVQADYVYDPADLPAGFRCDDNADAQACTKDRRFSAWYNTYGSKFDRWYFGFIHDTDHFFESAESPEDSEDLDGEPDGQLYRLSPNLVDAVYSIALRRYGAGWSFAVQMVCAGPALAQRDSCKPKLRMVSFRKSDEIDPATHKWLQDFLPVSRAEVAAELRAEAKWEEADLRTCKGAIDQLLAFPAQTGGRLWHPGYANWLRGKGPKAPSEIIVTADGDAVFVRANGMEDPASSWIQTGVSQVVYSQANRGQGYDWALKMARVVQPCLRPATAPAPWDRAQAVHGGDAR